MNQKEIDAANRYIANIERDRTILENLDHPAHGTKRGYKAGCRCTRCLQVAQEIETEK